MKTTTLSTLCLGLAFVCSSLFFTHCKKDEKDPETNTTTPSTETNTQRLTGKNFKMTAAIIDPSIFGVTDYYAQVPDCEKDNLIRFDTPTLFKNDEGATKCNTNDAQTKTGTWVWNTDETILTITVGDDVVSWNVIINDGTTLKVKHSEQINGTNYNLTTTYLKQ